MEKVKPWLGEPQNTIAVLQKYGFVFQKKYGQNFLIDPRVLEKIIKAAEITEDDCVLEIGPGNRHHDPASGLCSEEGDRRGDRPCADPDPSGYVKRL